MNYRIEKYHISYYEQWNAFVSRSKNGTFLFHRDFMEYHSDRFEDFSLLVFDNTKLVGIVPANKRDNCVYSHQGLTYGGLILENSLELDCISDIFSAVIQYLKYQKIDQLYIKQVPYIYHKRASHEAEYIFHKMKAQLYRKDLNLAIDYSKPLEISKSKLKHYRRVSGLGLEIKQDNDFKVFWDNVLTPRLNERHNVNPVHTKEEIQLLHNRFPDNILQYNVYCNGDIVAGITLFWCGNVVKSQYGATTAKGEKLRALDFVFITLLNEFKGKVAFFDMGTVTRPGTHDYNPGLMKQKQELGCDVYMQDFYEIDLGRFEIH